jgi:hypothetical protein
MKQSQIGRGKPFKAILEQLKVVKIRTLNGPKTGKSCVCYDGKEYNGVQVKELLQIAKIEPYRFNKGYESVT